MVNQNNKWVCLVKTIKLQQVSSLPIPNYFGNFLLNYFMPRYYSIKKQELDILKKIDVASLKKMGYLEPHCYKSGVITWSKTWSDEKDSMGIGVSTEELWCSFTYTQTKNDEKESYDYKVQLSINECYFGGLRYWFHCPLSKNNVYCGKRVAALYLADSYFGCRDCHNLTYHSRNTSRTVRNSLDLTVFNQLFDAEELGNKVKKRYYKGKPTKRFIRYQKADDKAWLGLALLKQQGKI